LITRDRSGPSAAHPSIGDIDEDEIVFAEAASGDLAEQALRFARALGGLERRILLRAVSYWKWASRLDPTAAIAPLVIQSPAAALTLADDLARLMDE